MGEKRWERETRKRHLSERKERGGEARRVDAGKERNEIDFISAPRAIASTEICDDHLRAIEKGWQITTVS